MKELVNKNPRELSFTIFETIVAVGLLMAFALEMAGGQGNIVNKVEYARRSNDAIWLAKRIMAQVEYNYQTMELKELETTTSVKDKEFADLREETEIDYRYSVDIQEWKFPLFDFLMNGGLKSEEEENDPTREEQDPAAAAIPGLDAILNQIFQGHIMKIAHVEVSWPDGARRESVSLTYLLTNNKALDEYLFTKKGVFDGVIKKMQGSNAPQIATGPTCVPADGEGAVNAPGGGGCIRAGNVLRRPDGSLYAEDGTLIAGPPTMTPTPGGGTPPGTPPTPGSGGTPPPTPNQPNGGGAPNQ
ncbi:hypothetical protein [Oligoflexus tunisiensis]|uniref:hypothetical protein n=1 Tax=Oligoflexus tunisiensis TaxID=708132 RepID=UPI000A5A2EDD|nr:hypothetical protein [Oligoflexus tunisiensis]